MEENNAVLMEKLARLNELEITKSKILAIIFQKTTKEIVKKKIQTLKFSFEKQAEFYDQKLENYTDIYQEILEKYEEQLLEIMDKYKELYVNMYLELQEAECNQKIAITNLKTSYDLKRKVETNKIEEYNRKINACFQKKNNYDIIINQCEKELNQCVENIEKEINSLFIDKSQQLSLKGESRILNFLHKVRNIFCGKTKFSTYVIEPIHIELEMMENKMPDIIDTIEQRIIVFIAKMKQAKEETNKIFNEMI